METESSRRAVAPVAPCKSAAGMASTTAPTGVGRLKAVFIYINILYNSMGRRHAVALAARADLAAGISNYSRCSGPVGGCPHLKPERTAPFSSA